MTRDEWLAELGVTVKTARVCAGLTQLQLAERLGCSRHIIRHWELGQSAPSLADLPALASALGIHPVDLIPTEIVEVRSR